MRNSSFFHPVFIRQALIAFQLLLGAALLSASALADELRPIQPFDLSSPRSTLQSFIQTMNARYDSYWGPQGIFQTYLRSKALFTPKGSLEAVNVSSLQFPALWAVLNTEELPKALIGESEWRLALILKEILDRVDLPPFESIPDEQDVRAQGLKRWTIPGTNLQLSLVESGSRTGQWLFTPETVAHLNDFYREIKGQPYKSFGSPNWYVYTISQPIGLAILLQNIVPARFFLSLPGWMLDDFLDQPLWRWFGIFLVFILIGLLFRAALTFQQKDDPNQTNAVAKTSWRELLPSLSLVVTLPLGFYFLVDILRVSDRVYSVISIGMWSLFYLALTGLIWRSLTLIAIRLEPPGTQPGAINHPLLRMFLRLLSIVLCTSILIEGASRLGVPADSMLAGLGLGGLAVALAGQQALSNLFASLIIMLEKPFQMGHIIRAGDIEGVVEDVGFRSTRIRSANHTLQTIPSNTLINHSVENLSIRTYWRVTQNVHLDQDTPTQQVDALIEKTKSLIAQHPLTNPEKTQVLIAEITTHGIRLLVIYFVKVQSPKAELDERHKILHGILVAIQSLGIKLARDT